MHPSRSFLKSKRAPAPARPVEADRRLTSGQAVCALRNQVQEAGHPANFVQPQAMAEIIHQSSGIASDLSMLTGLCLFVARLAEAPQITLAHVEQAVRIKNGTDLGDEPDFDDDGAALAAAPTAMVARPAVTEVPGPRISKLVSPGPGSRRGVGLGSVVAVAVAALGIGVAGGLLLTSHRLVHGSGPVTADAPVPAVPTLTADVRVTDSRAPEPPPAGAFVPTIATPPVPAVREDPALPSTTVSPALASTPAPGSPAPALPAPVPSLPDPAPQAAPAPVPAAPLPRQRPSSEPSPTPTAVSMIAPGPSEPGRSEPDPSEPGPTSGQPPPREQPLPAPAAQPVPAAAALPDPKPVAAVAPDPPPAAPVETASSAPADVPAPRQSEPSSPGPQPAPAVAAVAPPAPDASVPSAPGAVLAAAAAVVAEAAARREAPPAAAPSPEAEPPLPPATPVHIMLVYDPLMPQAETRAALLAAILRDHGYEVPPALPSASRGEPALSYVFAQDRPSAASIAQVLGLEPAQVHAAASPEPGLIRIAVVPPGPRSAASYQQRSKRNTR